MKFVKNGDTLDEAPIVNTQEALNSNGARQSLETSPKQQKRTLIWPFKSDPPGRILFIHDPLTTTSTEESFLQDSLLILKWKLQNY